MVKQHYNNVEYHGGMNGGTEPILSMQFFKINTLFKEVKFSWMCWLKGMDGWMDEGEWINGE